MKWFDRCQIGIGAHIDEISRRQAQPTFSLNAQLTRKVFCHSNLKNVFMNHDDVINMKSPCLLYLDEARACQRDRLAFLRRRQFPI